MNKLIRTLLVVIVALLSAKLFLLDKSIEELKQQAELLNEQVVALDSAILTLAIELGEYKNEK